MPTKNVMQCCYVKIKPICTLVFNLALFKKNTYMVMIKYDD